MAQSSSGSLPVRSVLFRILRVFIVLLVAAGLAYLLFSLKKEPEKKETDQTPPSVRIIEAIPVSAQMNIEAFGTVKPRHMVQISVEVSGRIEALDSSFVAGGTFKKGTTLVRIDQRSYRLNRDLAKVKVSAAKIDIESLEREMENLEKDLGLAKENADLAKKELERVTALTQNEFVSRTNLDKVRQQYLQAKIQRQGIENRIILTRPLMEQKKAALLMAETQLESAQLALDKTQIDARFDGYVLEKLAETGEYVNPGQVIGRIYEKGKLDVDIRIPTEQLKWVKSVFENGKMPGAFVQTPETERTQQQEWPAKVARIQAKIDEKTRTLPMTLEIEDSFEGFRQLFHLKPGAFVKCIIHGRVVDDVFVLPRHLVRQDDVVYTVAGGVLKIKKVRMLRKFEDKVYIDAGLAAKDKIVSSPLPGAVEGMRLVIMENGK